MSYSQGRGRATPGVRDACYLPVPGPHPQPHPLVVFCHGAGRYDAWQAGGRMFGSYRTLLSAVAGAGFVVAVPTLTNLWGNSTAAARIADAVRWARAELGAADRPPAVVGASMGTVCALNYAAEHPVAGVVGLIPVVDLERVRSDDHNRVAAGVDAAWDVHYPGRLPGRADPAAQAGRLAPIAQQLWYAAGDPASAGIERYAAAVGADLRDVGPLGHTDAAMAAAEPAAIVRFLRAVTAH